MVFLVLGLIAFAFVVYLVRTIRQHSRERQLPTGPAPVVGYLRRCPGAELSEILAAVLTHRPEARPEGSTREHRLALAMATKRDDAGRTDARTDGDWEVRLVAPGPPDGTDVEGTPFRRYGACPRCDVSLCSHVSPAVCPTCGASVELG